MNNRYIYMSLRFNNQESIETNKKFMEESLYTLYDNSFYKDWEFMEFHSFDGFDYISQEKLSPNTENAREFLFSANTKLDRTIVFRRSEHIMNMRWSIKDFCAIGFTFDPLPFPATQSTAESFRDFAQSFIWDYSLLKSFSVDVPLGREGWEQVAERLKLGSPGTIKDSWIQILSPADYSNFFTKEQMLAAPAYYVEELPEGRVLYQLYPNPWADPSTPELAEYLNPLYHYLQKIKYPDSL
jgi:hypothetical protein